MSRNVQYVTNEDGERTAVIMPIEEYEELLEDLHVTHAAEETKDEPRRPFSEVVDELRKAGEVDVCYHLTSRARVKAARSINQEPNRHDPATTRG